MQKRIHKQSTIVHAKNQSITIFAKTIHKQTTIISTKKNSQEGRVDNCVMFNPKSCYDVYIAID